MSSEITLAQPTELLRSDNHAAAVQQELLALTDDELIPLNVDVASALCTVLGALPQLRRLRPQIIDELPRFNLVAFDRLELYARALTQSHARYRTISEPPDHLRELTQQAADLRARLLADGQSLALRGLIDAAPLAPIKKQLNPKAIAIDLTVLTILLRSHWPRIEGKCPTPLNDLTEADRIAPELLLRLGRRQHPNVVATAANHRLRAFTLLARTYDDARRAITYLCARTTNPNAIAPSLYGGRKRRKRVPAAAEVQKATEVP